MNLIFGIDLCIYPDGSLDHRKITYGNDFYERLYGSTH